jgi:hypothetical protein
MIPLQELGACVTMRSKVVAFPVRNRLGDIKRCAAMLDSLHGVEANDFWRTECRALAAKLTALGYSDAAMRHEVMEFQSAVQSALLAASQVEERTAAEQR